ncbi:MAG: radical SAM protein [Planctomycetes bacterium]|nr:radical SAM protein [Planctomycetota bacterium]
MKNILFVNAPSCFNAYSGTKANAVLQRFPLLSHALLAGVARGSGKKVEILDLAIITDWQRSLSDKIKEFKPDMVCMSSMTPLIFEVSEISYFIRKLAGKSVILAVGGPHPTAMPEDTLTNSAFDLLIVGEGEKAFSEVLNGVSYNKIPGIWWKDGEVIHSTPGYSTVDDLNSLPFPAYDLYDLSKYKMPKMVNRRSPMVILMTSRGCVFGCSFCNKNIFGRKIRFKSPEVVIEEIEYVLGLGVREIHIDDDMFTTDIKRAKEICEKMLKNNLKFKWNLGSGVRADRVDLEFLKLAKKAGCYQVGFGFESGDQKSLESVDKGITLEQSIKAMELVRKAGIESVGFFMLGLPMDTEESLKKTIAFAKKLAPTFAKATVTVPFPGTRLFEEYDRQGRIKSRDWSKYNFHSIKEIYEHPNLSMGMLDLYYNKFYRSFYLSPSYLLRTFLKSLKEGTIFYYVYYGLQTFFPRLFKTNPAK